MLTYDILSKPGERDHNEDCTNAARNANAYCFVLADGLGGHGGGEDASQLVVNYILHDFAEYGEVSEAYLRKCFEEGQRILLEEQIRQNRENEMKTTLVVLLTDGNTLQWGHIGDSRLYFFKNRKYRLRTLDHSVPQMLVAAGEIKEEEIRGHADRNRLLRVMGTEWESPRYKLSEPMDCVPGMEFLLCSDGFWEWIEEKAMQSTLKRSKSPAEWMEKMEREVLKNGTGKGMDNYSAVTVFIH